MPYRYLTISVDDGCPEDQRAADLLHKHGLKATFYVPARNPERPVIEAGQLREIAKEFEIGGHTYHHSPLAALPDDRALTEIQNGKQWLEDLQGAPVVSFCYPLGKFNRRTPGLVRDAGFLGARTCLFNLHGVPENPYLWGLSTHACDHSKIIQVRHAILESNFAGLRNFFSIYKAATDWQQHFEYGLSHVKHHGGIVHLYFHSWEIELLGHWTALDRVLNTLAQSGLPSVTNGILFRHWNQLKSGQPIS